MAIKKQQLQHTTVNDLLIMSKAENYHRWLLSQFEGLIGNRVMDLGAGIGTYISSLTDRQLVVAVERDPNCVAYLKEKFGNLGNVMIIESDIENLHFEALAPLSLDTVLCFNLLEHIKDDYLLLKKLYLLLQENGRLLLVVPAYQALYGSIDEAVGHYRRYSKKELLKKLLDAGFYIEKVSRMNSLAVPGWFVVNRILKKNEQSPTIVQAYDKFIVPALSKLEKLIPPLVGLSLVVVGKKVS